MVLERMMNDAMFPRSFGVHYFFEMFYPNGILITNPQKATQLLTQVYHIFEDIKSNPKYQDTFAQKLVLNVLDLEGRSPHVMKKIEKDFALRLIRGGLDQYFRATGDMELLQLYKKGFSRRMAALLNNGSNPQMPQSVPPIMDSSKWFYHMGYAPLLQNFAMEKFGDRLKEMETFFESCKKGFYRMGYLPLLQSFLDLDWKIQQQEKNPMEKTPAKKSSVTSDSNLENPL